MNLTPLIVTVIILTLVIIYVTRPLFSSKVAAQEPAGVDLAALRKAAYESTLDRIRELDFEFKLGKMSPAEYEEQRTELKNQAALLLKELREVQPAQKTPAGK